MSDQANPTTDRLTDEALAKIAEEPRSGFCSAAQELLASRRSKAQHAPEETADPATRLQAAIAGWEAIKDGVAQKLTPAEDSAMATLFEVMGDIVLEAGGRNSAAMPDAVAKAASEFLAWIDYDFPSGVRAQEKAARERLRSALAGLDPSPEPAAAAKAKFEAEFEEARRDLARGAHRTDHRFKL